MSRMYDPFFYSIATTIVEVIPLNTASINIETRLTAVDGFQVPYMAVTTLLFTLPFFYIVGFDNSGLMSENTVRFFWYWLFHYLYTAVFVFLGQLIACSMPTQSAATGTLSICSTKAIYCIKNSFIYSDVRTHINAHIKFLWIRNPIPGFPALLDVFVLDQSTSLCLRRDYSNSVLQ
jgi:hypothetical protein